MLTGKYKHKCVYNNNLTIDETMEEFHYCSCFEEKTVVKGVKYDTDKPNVHSVLSQFPNALLEVVRRGDLAIPKYKSYDNWTRIDKERYKNALMRHYLAICKGEFKDPETNQLHWSAIAWNALAILELELKTGETK